LTAIPRTPDCGPHCKVKGSPISGGIRIVHCNRKKCDKCHNEPVRNRTVS